ncbi:hypothetical protein QBC33DRAFT_134998 [Phialemonium atrogriseum]|uniref:Polyprenal reductase n=1 Tax=Phialemonium atrogriseum TaxID=1093897 RepID=A0AAJ0BWJ0_9PEZI|nr:uncharacterized protein QBC33DRAFT_134998 [Phialemonium atrogriseum]KAK1765773.1 hypothetical protein QBC33DRAFT_134998 [Phialemonium atrogriseum]
MPFSYPALPEFIFDTLCSISPAEWCRAFFILSSSSVLAVAATPEAARRYLLDYGARTPAKDSSNGRKDKTSRGDGPFVKLVAMVTSCGQVPHSWFIAFYTTSLTCSIFWLIQYLTRGNILDFVASRQAGTSDPSMSLGQVVLVWTLMFLQASRRVYEHLVFIKPSASKMWIVHWSLGICFYLCMSISVWVEGSEPILNRPLNPTNMRLASLKSVISVLVYLFAWTNQYRCHKYLAGLKKYSLPGSGMFSILICPHYTCECLLYTSLMVAAAPEGSWYNKTLLSALVFVLVNLGVTARGTRKWSIDKFGAESVAAKWNMIPFVF